MPSIVVADSCPLTRAILSRFLSDAGIKSLPVSNARDVVQQFNAPETVPLLLIDLESVVCGGLSVVRYVRKLPASARLKIIGLTHARERPQLQQMLVGGVDSLVLKEELTREILVQRVKQYINGAPTGTAPAPVAQAPAAPAPVPTPVTPAPKPLTPQQVEEAIISVATARAMKPIVHEVIVVTNNPRAELADLVRVIRNDLSLTAKLIGTANSAFYRRGIDVKNLQEAISLIGVKGTRELAVSLSVVDEMNDPQLDPAIALPCLWGHSLATAHLLETIATQTKLCDPGQAFIVGLLHDYGRRLMTWQAPEHYRYVLQSSDRADVSLVHRERRIVGMDHAVIASRVMERWGCPAVMSRAVGLHHSDSLWEASFSDPIAGLLRGLRLADGLATAFGFEADGNDDLGVVPSAWLKSAFADPEKTLQEMHGSLLERIGLLMSRSKHELPLPEPWKGDLDQIVLLASALMPLEPLQAMLSIAYNRARLVTPGKCSKNVARTLIVADLRCLDTSQSLAKLSWLSRVPEAADWPLLLIGLSSDTRIEPLHLPNKRMLRLSGRLTPATLRAGVESLAVG